MHTECLLQNADKSTRKRGVYKAAAPRRCAGEAVAQAQRVGLRVVRWQDACTCTIRTDCSSRKQNRTFARGRKKGRIVGPTKH